MKQLMFLFLLLHSPLLIFPQAGWTIFDTLPKGVERIALPATRSANSFNGDNYVIADDAAYKAMFADSIQSTLPAIDFRRYDLVSKTYCNQCQTVCGNHPQCHRNACKYTRAWFLLDKHNRIALRPDTLNAESCNLSRDLHADVVCYNDSCFTALRQNCRGLKNDTVNFQQSVVLARTIYADCAAQISHEVYMDTANHCVVWRLFVGDGGCHSMSRKSFVFEIQKPPAGYTILFEEYRKPEVQ